MPSVLGNLGDLESGDALWTCALQLLSVLTSQARLQADTAQVTEPLRSTSLKYFHIFKKQFLFSKYFPPT